MTGAGGAFLHSVGSGAPGEDVQGGVGGSGSNQSALPLADASDGSSILPIGGAKQPTFPHPDFAQMLPFKPKAYPRTGSHPVAGGEFPPPPAASALIHMLPPPECFHGPFVQVDKFLEHFLNLEIPEGGFFFLVESFIINAPTWLPPTVGRNMCNLHSQSSSYTKFVCRNAYFCLLHGVMIMHIYLRRIFFKGQKLFSSFQRNICGYCCLYNRCSL